MFLSVLERTADAHARHPWAYEARAQHAEEGRQSLGRTGHRSTDGIGAGLAGLAAGTPERPRRNRPNLSLATPGGRLGGQDQVDPRFDRRPPRLATVSGESAQA